MQVLPPKHGLCRNYTHMRALAPPVFDNYYVRMLLGDLAHLLRPRPTSPNLARPRPTLPDLAQSPPTSPMLRRSAPICPDLPVPGETAITWPLGTLTRAHLQRAIKAGRSFDLSLISP